MTTVTTVPRIRYEEPPPRVRRANILHTLSLMTLAPREEWGRSARIATYSKPTVAYAQAEKRRNGEVKVPGGPSCWEFVSGRMDEPDEDGNTHAVWARYLGPNGEAS